jgi:glycosyl transferase family 25
MAGQLDALGLEWERIEAVSPDTLDPPPMIRSGTVWERPLRSTEMAACASHMAAWQRIRELGEPCLVLEDDALLDRSVPDLLSRLARASLAFDHVSLETRGRKKLLARGATPNRACAGFFSTGPARPPTCSHRAARKNC